jgi:hypothetical protein
MADKPAAGSNGVRRASPPANQAESRETTAEEKGKDSAR